MFNVKLPCGKKLSEFTYIDELKKHTDTCSRCYLLFETVRIIYNFIQLQKSTEGGEKDKKDEQQEHHEESDIKSD